MSEDASKPKLSRKEKSARTHLFWRTFWIGLCIIGNAWQAILVCSSYFGYDIVTTVTVAFPSEFPAPSMTVCFYVVTMIKWAIADKKYPDLRERMGKFHDSSIR